MFAVSSQHKHISQKNQRFHLAASSQNLIPCQKPEILVYLYTVSSQHKHISQHSEDSSYW